MNTEHFLKTISEVTWQFEKITLEEMDGVKLMDRMDIKFVIPLHLMAKVLHDAKPYYKILEINNRRKSTYETLYFDTPDYQLYHSHHSGRLNRYKVRFRNYADTNLSYFEIKHKNNKGRTIKIRIDQPNKFESNLTTEQSFFLENNTPLIANELIGNIRVDYNRITLVNKISKERVTMDLDLTFAANQKEINYQQLVIAEVKQEKLGASPILEIFKKYQLRPGSISKYCLGVMSTDNSIKHNLFKTKFLHLKKTIAQYDSITGTGV